MGALRRARLLAVAVMVLGLATASSTSAHRTQVVVLRLSAPTYEIGPPCGDPGAYGQRHAAEAIDFVLGSDLLNDPMPGRVLIAAPPPAAVATRDDVNVECTYSDHPVRTDSEGRRACIKTVDYITSNGRHFLAVADPDLPYACSTTPESRKPYALIARAVPHGRANIGSQWTCDDETIGNVPGAQLPAGCVAIADVTFRPRPGLDASIFVFRLPSLHSLNVEEGQELRYMRQYDGLRQDVSVPGLRQSRFIHTGSVGDLSEVVFTNGRNLVKVWLSDAGMSGGLRPSDLRAAVKAAKDVNALLTTPG
jgi:hypothetical protein